MPAQTRTIYKMKKEPKTPKTIWCFNHYAITPDFPGGTRHFELCKNMALQGNDVTLFASNFIHMTFRFLPIPDDRTYRVDTYPEYNNFKFTWLKTLSYSSNNWRRLANMFSYCRRVLRDTHKLVRCGQLQKPDVVWGSTVHPFAALTAARVARRYKVPFIFEIRDLWPQSFIDMGIWKEKSLRSRIFRWIEKKSVQKAQRIIGLAPATKEYLIKTYNLPENHVCYIPNGVDLKAFSNVPPPPRKDDTLILMYLGGIEDVHKLDILFDAMEKLDKEKSGNPKPGIRMQVYGDGKRKAYFMEKYAHVSNIQWMGSVKKTQVPHALAAADVLFQSTAKVLYGVENKLFEYLASGKPIIASVYKSHNDLASRIGAGISIPPGDVDAVVEAVKQFRQMPPAQRNEMGLKGRRYAEQNNDWSLLANRLLELIQEAIHETHN